MYSDLGATTEHCSKEEKNTTDYGIWTETSYNLGQPFFFLEPIGSEEESRLCSHPTRSSLLRL